MGMGVEELEILKFVKVVLLVEGERIGIAR
jgi:hypothetical protein